MTRMFPRCAETIRAQMQIEGTEGATQYGEWTLPGGDRDSYREIILTLPVRAIEDTAPTDEAAAPFMPEWEAMKAQHQAIDDELQQVQSQYPDVAFDIRKLMEGER